MALWLTPYGGISWSTSARVIACCLTTQSNYQCWLLISKVQWHSYQSNLPRHRSLQSLKLIWKLLINLLGAKALRDCGRRTCREMPFTHQFLWYSYNGDATKGTRVPSSNSRENHWWAQMAFRYYCWLLIIKNTKSIEYDRIWWQWKKSSIIGHEWTMSGRT